MPSQPSMQSWPTDNDDRTNFDPLPAAQPVHPYPGMPRRMQIMLDKVDSATSPLDEDWEIFSSSMKRIKFPHALCDENTARAFADLRDTMGEGPKTLFLCQGVIWHCDTIDAQPHPIYNVMGEYGISGAGLAPIDKFFHRALEQTPDACIHLGVKFKNMAFGRFPLTKTMTHTEKVQPGDPRFDERWALEFPDIDYDTNRVSRFRTRVSSIVDGDSAAEALARSVAAPVAQPYPHAFTILSGRGGDGKGLFLDSLLALYGQLGARFDAGAAFGASRSSSTTAEQAVIPLMSKLLTVTSDTPDLGKGDHEKLKRTATGEELIARLLKQNVTTANATAYMILSTNHGFTLPSGPEWDRRIVNVPFNRRLSEEEAIEWSAYLGDGSGNDDGIIDALMAGCASYADNRPDPRVASQLTEGLTDYGRLLRDKLMTCAPLQENGLPDHPRVRAADGELSALRTPNPEIRAQRILMGLASKTLNDIHGDKKNHQFIYIQDSAKFEPFAAEWRKEHDEAWQEKKEDDLAKKAAVERLTRTLTDAEPMPTDSEAGRLQGQIDLLRQCSDLDAKIILTDHWQGKGIQANWKDGSVQYDLRNVTIPRHVEKAGLLCAANLLVIDLDQSKDAQASGLDTLISLGVTEEDLGTLVMRSPHGYHLVYRMPDQWVGNIKAITHVNGTAIDLRPGEKSYVVAPGSHITLTDPKNGQTEECDYPGVIRLPLPETSDSIERHIPQLPDTIRQFIERDPKAFASNSAGATSLGASYPHSTQVESVSAGTQFTRVRPNATPYTPGQRHDQGRDQAWGLAHRCSERGASQEEFDTCMRQVRLNAGNHDPADTERSIRSAAEAGRYQYRPPVL